MRLLLVIALCWMAGPAMTLSCVSPDLAQTFARLHKEPETYVVVHGTLRFEQSHLPVTDWENQGATPQDTRIPAKLTGRSLTREGFTAPFDRDITFNAVCFGPWCASAETGADLIAFVEYRGGEYVFTLDPCYSTGFFDPDDAMLKDAASCMRGGPCAPKTR